MKLINMMKGNGAVVVAPLVYSGWDPTQKSSGLILSNGNKTATAASDGIVRSVAHHSTPSSVGSGQYSVEIHIDAFGSGIWLGFGTSAQSIATGNYPGNSVNSWSIASNGQDYAQGVGVSAVIPGGSGTWLAYGSTYISMSLAPDPVGGNVGHGPEMITSMRTDAGSSGYGPLTWPAGKVPPPGLDLYLFLRLTGGAQVTTNFGATAMITVAGNAGWHD